MNSFNQSIAIHGQCALQYYLGPPLDYPSLSSYDICSIMRCMTPMGVKGHIGQVTVRGLVVNLIMEPFGHCKHNQCLIYKLSSGSPLLFCVVGSRRSVAARHV